MFCVYGVSRKACEKKAHQQIRKLRGDDAPKSQEEYQAKYVSAIYQQLAK